MGLYVNSPQGLQMISGRGKAVYGASDIRKKTITTSIPGNSYVSVNVTFDDPLDSADYLVEVTGTSVADLSYLIYDKTVNGFKVYWSNYWKSGENVTVTYTAYKLYTDLEYNGLLNNQRYSTDEIDTGKTWIDGKKIYRKVFTGLNITGNSSSPAWVDTSIVMNDIDQIISCLGKRNKAINYFTAQYYDGSLKVHWSVDKLSGTDTLILEYTKTTD